MSLLVQKKAASGKVVTFNSPTVANNLLLLVMTWDQDGPVDASNIENFSPTSQPLGLSNITDDGGNTWRIASYARDNCWIGSAQNTASCQTITVDPYWVSTGPVFHGRATPNGLRLRVYEVQHCPPPGVSPQNTTNQEEGLGEGGSCALFLVQSAQPPSPNPSILIPTADWSDRIGVNGFYLAVLGPSPGDAYTGTVDGVEPPWIVDDIQGDTAVAYLEATADADQTAIFDLSNAETWGICIVTYESTEPATPPPPPPPPCVPVGGNGVFVSDLDLFIGPATALYDSYVPSAAINFYETTNEGRHSIVLDFNQGGGLYSRDLGTVFSWPLGIPNPRTVLYVWQPSTIPMPEGTYGRATDWIDGGTIGDKFVQGIEIEADSFNNPKTFFLEDSDTLTLHSVNETPTTFNQQSIKSFSCSPPFVAHSVRVISTDGIEWRVWNTKLVFQPWPSLCKNWQTEMTSLGMIGWGHVREMNISYLSFDVVTLQLTFDSSPTITISLPSTAGSQTKTKVTLPANKFKLIGLQAVSPTAFRLFADDLQLKIKSWGSTEAYQILRPFGGPSRTGATV